MNSEQIMKACQVGFASYPSALDDANNLLSECYGHIGRLVSLNSGWIEFNHKEPEQAGNYLIVTNYEGLIEMEWAYFNSSGQWRDVDNLVEYKVTHWRHLPDLPREAGE